jgi:hypothetical protein
MSVFEPRAGNLTHASAQISHKLNYPRSAYSGLPRYRIMKGFNSIGNGALEKRGSPS